MHGAAEFMLTWLGNQISLSPHSGHATLHSFGILIAPHPCVVSFYRNEPLVQVRTQLDKGNTSVSERYKTRLLEPEEVTHCQNLTFRHLGTGSNFHAMVIPAPSRGRFFLLKMEVFSQSPLHTEFFVTGITLVEEEYLPNIANEFYD